MKKLSIFLLFLVSISSKCLAVDYVAFNSPHDGDSYTITSGTTMNITIDFSYYTDKQSYLFKLTTEQGTVTISNGHTVNNVTAGAKHWSIELQMYDGQYWTTTSDAVDFSVVYGPRNITADNNFTASDVHMGRW
ncbi:MAG: hypothetical protein GW788_01920 [Ignavibacteria bacterium]|nr:hypothetical protein [Ignavibacteria bacterium]